MNALGLVPKTKLTLMEGPTMFLFCFTTLFCVFRTCTAVDTIAANQTLRDGDTIVSAGGSFELGFFSPGTSTNRYLGIWYKKISAGTVAWVANRKIPLNDTSGMLRVNHEGILVLFNNSNSIIWSSSSSRSLTNPVAQLLETGNLVIKDENENDPANYVWQSFNYPTHIFLPGMKLGKDLLTGLVRYVTSWRSTNDPSPGEWTVYMDIDGYPQIVRNRGSSIESRLGPWNGLRFTGMPSLKPNPIYTFQFVFNQKEIFYKYELINSSVVTMMILSPDGSFQRLNWIDRTKEWFLYSTPGADNCARYALCGPNGNCNINNSPSCACLDRFKPRIPEEWSVADWSSGCIRRTPLDCRHGDGFQKYTNMKLPDTQHSWFNESMTLGECEIECLTNCSCSAYSNMDIRGIGSGCFLWFGDLIDMREYPADGQDIYIRIAASELGKERGSSIKRPVRVILISMLLVLATVSGICLLYAYKRRKLRRKGQASTQVYSIESQNDESELPLFRLSTILESTNNFSIEHKLGEGGFGSVYKGELGTGQEIAVKKLSHFSGQGLEEFRNETLLISKLQHRNLVRILGCCLEGEERMLVYEYLPNKSLDYFIFDEDRGASLTWKHRFEIATGIAKGLLYLHHDSRLRIIHRDLKASNILLDSELNPKISDFGIARIFGGDQIEGKTKRIIGTYGYMSPEYALRGQFSMKSDVFSFGVLLLEIVSGKRSTKYHHPDHHHSLLGHAWLLWREGKALDLVDASLWESIVESQVLRLIQVGLLCIQQFPEDRPTISSVSILLGSEEAKLPQPKYPGFFSDENSTDADIRSDKVSSLTENALTITMIEPR